MRRSINARYLRSKTVFALFILVVGDRRYKPSAATLCLNGCQPAADAARLLILPLAFCTSRRRTEFLAHSERETVNAKERRRSISAFFFTATFSIRIDFSGNHGMGFCARPSRIVEDARRLRCARMRAGFISSTTLLQISRGQSALF